MLWWMEALEELFGVVGNVYSMVASLSGWHFLETLQFLGIFIPGVQPLLQQSVQGLDTRSLSQTRECPLLCFHE